VAEAAHPTAASTDALRAAAGRILAITVQETLPEALRQELQDLAIKIRALASSPPPGQTTAEAVGPTLQEGKRATSAPPPTEGLDVHALLREVVNSGVVHEPQPPGIDYATIQVDMDTWTLLGEYARLSSPEGRS
jgi:hypothetical protein